jgi:hypothetical protein
LLLYLLGLVAGAAGDGVVFDGAHEVPRWTNAAPMSSTEMAMPVPFVDGMPGTLPSSNAGGTGFSRRRSW